MRSAVADASRRGTNAGDIGSDRVKSGLMVESRVREGLGKGLDGSHLGGLLVLGSSTRLDQTA